MNSSKILFCSWGGSVVDNRGKAPGAYESVEGVSLPQTFREGEERKALAGWGGILVRSQDVDIIDLCRAHLEAVRGESKKCDKCNYCSTGYNELLDVFQDILKGEATEEDLEFLESAAEAIREAGKCSIGKAGPIPLLHALKFFREEFLATITGERQVRRGTYFSRLTAPCMEACPIHLDVPRYVERIKEAKFVDSLRVITEKLPLPGVLGRVCFRPCESHCRRANVDKAISIKALKRFAADQALKPGDSCDLVVLPSPRTGKVAVVGAGPAGITCAYHLAKRGHRVTVFEKLKGPGGMGVMGIPSYRLPRQVLSLEIQTLERLGVQFLYGRSLGEDISLLQLEEEFDAVFLAVGAQKSIPMKIEGEAEGYKGVFQGLDFLREINQGRDPYPEGKRVAVIGGGNVAIDCARSCVRLGKEQVSVVYRRSPKEMPADPEEIRDAEEEGVDFRYLSLPLKILAEGGTVVGLKCIRMELGEPDRDGRPHPLPIPGSEFFIDCDMVITAVGQAVDPSALEGIQGLANNPWHAVRVDEATCQTSRPKIFAGGDCQTGPDTFVAACAGGLRAAQSIDRMINGLPLEQDQEAGFEMLFRKAKPYDPKEVIPKVEPSQRRQPVRLSPESRRSSWEEVEGSFTVQEAVAEAERCLRCYYVATVAV